MIDICLISDIDYIDHVYTCIKSMYIFKNKNSKYSIHVLLDMNEEDFIASEKRLKSLTKKNFNVECLRQSSEKYSIFEREDFHVKAADLLKFDLMNIFSYLNKILYLDSDIIVKDDLSELYNIDIKDYFLAANYHAKSVDEIAHTSNLRLKHVYNAGVMVFNLKKMRQEGLYDKLIEERKTNKYILKAKSLDQLTFNYCCKNSYYEFDPKYNIMFRNNWNIDLYNTTYNTNFKTFNDVIEDSSIIHFVGKDCKPWYPKAKAYYLWQCCKEFNNLDCLKLYDSKNINELKQETRNVIVFSFDENVIIPAIVAMYSMLTSLNVRTKVQIICLTSPGVSLFDRAKIYYFLSKSNKDFVINFINTEDVLKSDFDNVFVIRGITKPAYYRLFLDKILPNFRYVVYSDIDVVFKKNVFSALSKIDQDKTVFAVPSVSLYSKSQFKDGKWEYYFNSGFLIINVDKLKEENKSEDVTKLMCKKYIFQDQDILNELFKDNIGKLPPTFCFIPSAYLSDKGNKYAECYEHGIFTKTEVNSLTEPAIIHYAGVKPWEDKTTKMSDEWFIIYDKLFDRRELEIVNNKAVVVDKQEVQNRTTILNLIGKEFMITRLAGLRSFQLDLSKYKPPFVVRSEDYQKEIVFKTEADIKSMYKIRQVMALKQSSKMVFIEKFIQGAFNAYVNKTGHLYTEGSVSFNTIELLFNKAKILLDSFSGYSQVEFLIAGENVYFKRLFKGE